MSGFVSYLILAPYLICGYIFIVAEISEPKPELEMHSTIATVSPHFPQTTPIFHWTVNDHDNMPPAEWRPIVVLFFTELTLSVLKCSLET